MTTSEKQNNRSINALTLVKQVFVLYKKHFNIFFGYSAWLFLPLVLSILSFVTLDPDNFEFINLILSFIVGGILMTWIHVICINLTTQLFDKKQINFQKISIESWKILIPFLLITILINFIVFAGFIFLIIPGIILGTLLVFSSIIVVLEYSTIIESIKKSYKLVSESFFDILIKLLVGYTSIFTLYIIGAITIYLITCATSGIDPMTYLETPPSLLEEILMRSLTILLLPLLPIFHTLLYLNTKKD